MAIHETLRREDKVRSGLALGGIGAGWFELRKDGCFYNWNICNNAPFGSGPHFPLAEDSMFFFIVRFQEKGKDPRMKLLQVDQGYEVAAIPSHYYTFPWLTGVDEIEYTASYPFSTLTFRDADMPVEVEMTAFTPFIPHDVKNSALPAAIFDFRVTSRTKNPVDVMLMATMRNAVGFDVRDRHYVTNIESGKGYRLFEMTCGGMDETHPTFGTQAVASLAGDSTYYTGWEHRHPYYEYVIRNRKLRNHDDTAGRNSTDKETGQVRAGARLFSTIARSRRLTNRQSFEHSFVVSWHFPNLYAGRTQKALRREGPVAEDQRRLEGHYYANFFQNASDVAQYVVRNRRSLTDRSREFHADFFDSTAPAFLLDQVNSQLNTFATSAWLTKDGNFGIQEGMTPERNWGPLATIDVGMYGSLSAAALFPELDKSMMRAHMRLQDEATGSICHGIGRDFTKNDAGEKVTDRLDLPSQYVIMALRGYFWTSDLEYLREIWPSVKAAIEYVLRDRDANGDLLPDMGGSMCTYDNFPMYGAASFVASQWLAALAFAAKAGKAVGDDEAAERYDEIRRSATPVFEDKLWTGEHYRLYNDVGGPRGDTDDACLTDQIIGQWAMHHVGLGDLLKRSRMRTALRTVMKLCYKPEYGLLNCRWPGDEFLHPVDENCWSDQANTCWSGVELAFASFLIYEGMVRDGLKVVRNVDDRYRKAGMYFDHQEFGGHYYRPMSAWALLNALLGLAINDGRLEFAPKLPDDNQKLFFAFGQGTAHYLRKITSRAEEISIEVRTGALDCSELSLALRTQDAGRVRIHCAGKQLSASTYSAEFSGKQLVLTLKRPLKVRAGKTLRIRVS